MYDKLEQFNKSATSFSELVTFDFMKKFKTLETTEKWFEGESFLRCVKYDDSK